MSGVLLTSICPLHQLDQALDNDQADARAFDAGAFGAESVERLEQMGLLLVVHATARVADRDQNRPETVIALIMTVPLRAVVLGWRWRAG